MVNDPIADLLTRIRNAQLRKQKVVSLPSSKMLVSIAGILKEEGFISNFEVEELKPQNNLKIELKYVNGTAAIRSLSRVSKPGVRKYVGYKEIQKVMSGLGVGIYSTPKGIMTDKKARELQVGGEYICFVY